MTSLLCLKVLKVLVTGWFSVELMDFRRPACQLSSRVTPPPRILHSFVHIAAFPRALTVVQCSLQFARIPRPGSCNGPLAPGAQLAMAVRETEGLEQRLLGKSQEIM